ncbi:MAG: ribosome silencing factor [Syntrophomonadaceae bacterium]|nr:ribosome silencing factor [Syntrophomonadaceae bacterium]
MTSELQLAMLIGQAAAEEHAVDVRILELTPLTVIADYFVICGGRSSIQLRSICDNIELYTEDSGVKPLRREGYEEAKWIVLDYGSVIVHMFLPEQREYYRLENLWSDAVELLPEAAPPEA